MRPTTKRTTRSSGGLALAAPRTLGDLGDLFGGEVDAGARGIVVRALAPVEIAGDGDLAPVVASRFVEAARACRASALLVSAELADRLPVGARWVHPHAMHALARALAALFTAAPAVDARAHAHVDPRADVDPSAIVGPGAVVLAGARVAAGAIIEPNAVVYGNVTVGARAIIGAGAVVGRPGFGWVASPDGAVATRGSGVAVMERVPQLGGVVIEDDAEVGALATVDAGTLGPTIVGRGAKLDAHVHVGHNAIIGAGAIVAAQAGFAGSAELGDGARVGGQAGFADHVRVGDGAQIAGQSGVIGDVAPGAVVAGYPAVDRARWLRAIAAMLRRK